MRRFLCVTLLISGLFACSAYERKESAYETASDAIADGAVRRGWIPTWLPASAREIREWHDLDTNRSFGCFVFGESDDVHVRALVEATTTDHTVAIEYRDGDPQWWPEALRGGPNAADTSRQRLEIAQADGFGVAVQWPSREVYFWQPGS